MATNTCWQDVLDEVTTRLKKTKALPKFAKLKTNEERVDFCLRDDLARNKVQQWLGVMCSSHHRKYWEKASELRSEGNLCFQEKDYDKAVEFYTQSILVAPFPNTHDAVGHEDELSLGFGNRSAALFHLTNYKECLEDIERAIMYNYPRDLRFKLFQRKGQCHAKLNQPSFALQAYDESLDMLRDARLDSRKVSRQKKEIELLKNAVELQEPVATNGDSFEPSPIPNLSYGNNPNLPSASSALEVHFDKHRGRHILTNKALSAGDTLFVERPYASVLLPGQYNTHCHHCYARVQAVLPCHQCSQVRYCSATCCDESWDKYHKWECGNLDLLHSVGLAHLSCRILFVTSLSKIQEFREELKGSDSSFVPSTSTAKVSENLYRTVYYLVNHLEETHIEDILQYALTALLILMLFDRVNYFVTLETQTLRERLSSCTLTARVGSAPSTPTHKSRSPVHSRLSLASNDESDVPPSSSSVELFLGGLVLHHILQMVCNATAITQLQMTSQSGNASAVLNQRQVRVATGIFLSSSLMNHSCKPTVISSFYKNVLIMRAIQDVEAGGQVFNCYGPHFRRVIRENRQRALLEQYFFLCDCEACRTEDIREQKIQALKCPYCSGPLGAPDTTNRTACFDCGKSHDCATQLQKVFTAHDMFVQGLQLAARGNFKDALERLKRCHRTREKVMYCHNRQLAEVQDQLACCYASLGKMLLAVEYLRPTLATTEYIYGPNSIELANELQKYSDLLINAVTQLSKDGTTFSQEIKNLTDEAYVVMDRSFKIFSIHYGPYHESVQELKQKRDQLKIFEP